MVSLQDEVQLTLGIIALCMFIHLQGTMYA